jgi:hypothetical protein
MVIVAVSDLRHQCEYANSATKLIPPATARANEPPTLSAPDEF